MMNLGVCAEMVFGQLPYEKRIAAIARAGYDRVELWLHEGKDAATLRQVCVASGVCLQNMVVNSPDGSVGGSPVNAGDCNKYLDRLTEVIEFAQAAGCTRAITCSGNISPALSRAKMRANLELALGQAAQIARQSNFTLLLEPLNTRVDHAGYYLDSSAEAGAIVRAVNNPNLRLLFDIYHMQIMEGNILANIEKNVDIIGHFHLAGVPGRHEPYRGEINYPFLLGRIGEMGYRGIFGLEYSPTVADLKSLKKTRAYLVENS